MTDTPKTTLTDGSPVTPDHREIDPQYHSADRRNERHPETQEGAGTMSTRMQKGQAMTDMREAVARVIYDASHKGLRNCYAWDETWEDYLEMNRNRYYSEAEAALSLMQPEIDRRVAEDIKDDHPEWGSVECKVSVYNDFHELAVEMGYPSMTEVFEALDEFRSDFAKCVAEERAKLLERLREPSEGMVAAAEAREDEQAGGPISHEDCWQAMLAKFEKENP